MKITITTASFSLLLLCMSSLALASQDSSENSSLEDPDVIDWQLAEERMSMLSQLGHHPFLMPLIMKNRDMLDLTKAQVKRFMNWRSKNRVPLIHTMNEIIKVRTDFQRLSLNPKTTEEELLAKQQEIFDLHRKVLKYQLSCRRNIIETFNEEQWDNFRFVLTENGYTLD